MARSRLAVAALLAAQVALPAFGAERRPLALGNPLPAPSFTYLDWLERPLTVEGHPRHVWAIYAVADRRGDFLGPHHVVDAPGEGLACVDDAARAAVAYLRRLEDAPGHRDADAVTRAEQALDFVEALDGGAGRYWNFVFADGRVNREGPTSRLGGWWWSARAFWALATGRRVLTLSGGQLQIAEGGT